MSKRTVADVFEIISSILFSFTLMPQVVLNYRLKNTENLSILTVILWIVSGEVSLFYLVWTKQLLFMSISDGIFAGTALFIACQIKHYRTSIKTQRKIQNIFISSPTIFYC